MPLKFVTHFAVECDVPDCRYCFAREVPPEDNLGPVLAVTAEAFGRGWVILPAEDGILHARCPDHVLQDVREAERAVPELVVARG